MIDLTESLIGIVWESISLCLRESVEDMISDGLCRMRRSTHTYLHSIKGICSELGDDIFDAVLSSATASFLISHFSCRDIDIVMDDEQVSRRIEFVEIHPKSDTLTGEVHIGLGFDEEDVPPLRPPPSSLSRSSWEGNFCLTGETVGLLIHRSCRGISLFGDLVDDEEAKVMFGVFVVGSGVTQSDDEFHE